ncbi:hypothetical protein F5X97DRAFT_250693 [Nemania serpens]|nr:hypothetical protein F5X97DRAFT_250693 [Nemania serpens]
MPPLPPFPIPSSKQWRCLTRPPLPTLFPLPNLSLPLPPPSCLFPLQPNPYTHNHRIINLLLRGCLKGVIPKASRLSVFSSPTIFTRVSFPVPFTAACSCYIPSHRRGRFCISRRRRKLYSTSFGKLKSRCRPLLPSSHYISLPLALPIISYHRDHSRFSRCHLIHSLELPTHSAIASQSTQFCLPLLPLYVPCLHKHSCGYLHRAIFLAWRLVPLKRRSGSRTPQLG